ncbi:MAG TPA: hypothetical protein VFV19_10425 [Candidatus Polarisedimenticolaceae bacterium]|nr:hypothetical protein [Candidatus Polarisedimenticolaceae bacterium]
MGAHGSTACRKLSPLVMALALGVTGCSMTVEQQLQRVAKDWCQTIRASQVLPIYPLSEDLQPGDVFLVRTPIQDQQREYAEKGYLQLDYHIKRIIYDGHTETPPVASLYPAFYGVDRYGINYTVHPPAQWQFPADGHDGETGWTLAPRAAFPSYSFSVSRSGGMNVGIPVQGVPVGLNLLGSSTATGSVTIADAYTYGVDIERMKTLLTGWADTQPAKDFLKAFPPSDTGRRDAKGRRIWDYALLRVVTRVYLTGRVNVSLFAGKSGGGNLSAGEPRPVDALTIGKDSDALSNLENVNRVLRGEAPTSGIKAVTGSTTPAPADGTTQTGTTETKNETGDTAPAAPAATAAATTGTATPPASTGAPVVAGAAAVTKSLAPGGSIQVASASSRTISMDETFPRPLVIGYLGFDVTIERDGKLGRFVSTLDNLLNRPTIEENPPVTYDAQDASVTALNDWLRHNDDAVNAQHRQALDDWLALHRLSAIPLSDFKNAVEYRAERQAAVKDLVKQ